MQIGQWVQFSIDDVIGCFQWVYENKPASIFEERMLAKIREWHRRYQLSCNLYVFEQSGGFSLGQMQDCYWEELAEESGWLRIGWHRRKAGPLTDDDETELASLERVHKLVREKGAENLWANKLRLHRWEASERLLQGLRKADVKILLTRDSEHPGYGLTETDAAILAEKGFLDKASFWYRRTDFRLDHLSDERKEEDFCAYAEFLLGKRLRNPHVECFFHEQKFGEIVLCVDRFWESFQEIKFPLIANAGVEIGETLYFTACNTSSLYVWNKKEEKVETVAVLPCKTNGCMKFSELVFYENCIWMVPWSENEIFIYHLDDKTTEVFPLPFLKNEEAKGPKFRKAVVDNVYLWLLPILTESVVRIDMKACSVDVFCNWPENVEFFQGRTMNFKMMTRHKDHLYLFRDGCTHNIVVDMKTGRMSIWDMDMNGAFGVFVDQNKLLLVPVKRHDPIRLLDMQTADETSLPIPDWIWREGKGYAFWYSKQLEDAIYIFPHEANATICYNITDHDIKWWTMDVDVYCTMRPLQTFGVYDVFQMDGEDWLFPFMGNVILSVAGKTEKTKEIRLFETVRSVRRDVEKDILYESKGYFLRNYLEETLNFAQREWTDIRFNGKRIEYEKEWNSIGEKIHREVSALENFL